MEIPSLKPLLIYDGECGFCRLWIDRWSQITGDRVQYVPFQAIGEALHDIPEEAFRRSVQLITPAGERFTGARAVLGALATDPRRRWMLRLYLILPGAALITESCYRWIARHRSLSLKATGLLWGKHLGPPSYTVMRWMFLRLLGVIYLTAFLSLGSQILGLIGRDGILPAEPFFRVVREYYGAGTPLKFPSLALLSAGDGFLQMLCWGGAAAAVLVIAGVAPALMLALSWLLYLSLFVAGQDFLSFQWDILLLETGFLAIFFAPLRALPRLSAERPPPLIVIWLFRLLLFRLMFFSGYVKLASGDPSWRNLTTLTFHYETQPLPTPLAWHAHQLPLWFQELSCAIMFGIELAVPLLFFAPRKPRLAACAATSIFMVLIIVTGNYTFFNFLALALCITLLDDSILRPLLPPRLRGKFSAQLPVSSRRDLLRAAVAVIIIILNIFQFYRLLPDRGHLPDAANAVANWFAPFCVVNRYGLFAVMTHPREEIVIEGSEDGAAWREYEFKYKPGDVGRPPPWVAPHQPRLDWQMWFAALGTYRDSHWFVNLCVRLLQGSPEVLDLLRNDPFGGKRPRYIRAELYEYHFTDYAVRGATGAWWIRERKGAYLPPISLRNE